MTRSTLKLWLLAALIMLAAYGILWGIVATIRPASAHEALPTAAAPQGWSYPSGCCYSAALAPTGDCAAISGKYVTEESDGYHLNLPVGSHPKLVTKGYRGIVPKKDARPSGDFDYHLCVTLDGAYRHCFFVAPGSS